MDTNLVDRLRGYFGGNVRTPDQKIADFSSLFNQMSNPQASFSDPMKAAPQIPVMRQAQQESVPPSVPAAPPIRESAPQQMPVQQGPMLQDVLATQTQPQQPQILQVQQPGMSIQDLLSLAALLQHFGMQQ
jgi:hypothetical protein